MQGNPRELSMPRTVGVGLVFVVALTACTHFKGSPSPAVEAPARSEAPDTPSATPPAGPPTTTGSPAVGPPAASSPATGSPATASPAAEPPATERPPAAALPPPP